MKKSVLLFLLFFSVTIIWIGTIFVVPKFYGHPTEAGTFGDMFGSINALFSGLAFVGVIVAILLQKDELELQRKELEETREELKGQKIQLQEQNKTLRKQAFEDTFFQLLKVYSDIVNSMDVESRFQTQTLGPQLQMIKGRDFFAHIHSLFSVEVKNFKKNNKITEITADNFDDVFLVFFESHKSDLSHYYRTIYNLLKCVDNSDIENKKFYTDIFRAQLSSYEILFLHYDCKSSLGKEKLAPLLEKYNVLKHLTGSEIIS